MAPRHFEQRVRITALIPGGEFVGSPADPEDAEQKKWFARFAIPGETIVCEQIEEKKNFRRGTIRTIETPSVDRVAPPCPAFGQCGGCDLQHMTLDAQRLAKFEMVAQTLLRKGGLRPEQGIELIGHRLPGFSYRNRIRLHVGKHKLGFYRHGSREIVDVPRCLIANEGINRGLDLVRRELVSVAEFASAVRLADRGGAIDVSFELRDARMLAKGRTTGERLLAAGVALVHFDSPRGARFATLGNGDDPSGSDGFSQVNLAANELLKQQVDRLVQNGPVLDLYAGSGNLSIPLAQRGLAVTAVESDGVLVERGRRLREDLALNSLEFVLARCEHYAATRRLAGTVVLDPPRAGAKEVVSRMRPKWIDRVVAVSCSLPTLLRDLQILAGNGFRLRSVFVLDMFPQTHHVETIAVLDG